MILVANQFQKQRGMALLLVIVVVALLSVIVLSLRLATAPVWEEALLDSNLYEARLLAESGLELARHPDVSPGDPILVKDFGDGRSFVVRIKTEGGRVLVNNLADEQVLNGVTELFTLWGLDANSAAIAAESLADWIDDDSETRSNGAEQPYYAGLNYPQFPTNQSMTSLETMLLVKGMDQVARVKPLWREYFTLYGDGMIDLNSSPPDLIEAFMGVSRDAAASFINATSGSDGIPDTGDEEPVTEVDEARQILGLTQEGWDEKSGIVTLEGSLRRIESSGRAGDTTFRLISLNNMADDASAAPVARFSE